MAAENIWEAFEHESTCRICLKLFTRHKVLPCGHTFCLDCLQRLSGRNLAFQCPMPGLPMLCNRPVQLPPGGVSDLPDIYIEDALGVFLFGRPPRMLRTGPIREISNPFGIAVSGNTCFVADYDQQNIQVLSFNGRSLYHFPTIVPGDDGQKIYPEDIAKDEEGNLWVVGNKVRELSTGFAVQYNTDGDVLRHFELRRSEGVRGVAVHTKKNLNVTHRDINILVTHRDINMEPTGAVLVYSLDGRLVKTVRQQGMNYPQDITVDREGRILVTDDDSYSVYVFNKDGEFLFQFGEETLQDPCGICTNVQGDIIVADQENGHLHVKVFDRSGRLRWSTPTDVVGPQAVAVTHYPGPLLAQLVVVVNVNNELAFRVGDLHVPLVMV